MTSIEKLYPTPSGRLMNSSDITKPTKFTIASYVVEKDNKQEDGVVLSFVNVDKRLRLNATNARAIATKMGDDPATWNGHAITVTSLPTTYQGKNVSGIRVIDVE